MSALTARACSAKTDRKDGPGMFARLGENLHEFNPNQQSGLGDRIEQVLTSFGITKERWIAFKKTHGLPDGCDCDSRKIWLNNFGDQFGIVARTALKTLLRMVG